MRNILLLNDIHLGVVRSAGTTQESQASLRNYLSRSLSDMLESHLDCSVVVNGDLFDTFNVAAIDVLEFYNVARCWLLHSADAKGDGPCLMLGRGNHDWSKDSSKLSSFDFITRILNAEFPERVHAICEPRLIFDGIYMIPHMPNQEQFDLAITQVPDDVEMLLVHANYDNAFAVEADHSLNFSAEQARALIARIPAIEIVFGHEHQAQHAIKRKVIVTGNQWPSSIIDCMKNPGGVKNAHMIVRREAGFELSPIETWEEGLSYMEVPWDQLTDPIAGKLNFVRVIGDATTEQAGDVVKAIADFRKTATAFVITNAVSIEGVTEMTDAVVNMEAVQSFDVLGYLFENLEPEQVVTVQALLAEAPELREAA